MSKIRRRDLTSSFVALAAKREEERNLSCDFDDDRECDKDRILPRFAIGFQLSNLYPPFSSFQILSLLKFLKNPDFFLQEKGGQEAGAGRGPGNVGVRGARQGHPPLGGRAEGVRPGPQGALRRPRLHRRRRPQEGHG